MVNSILQSNAKLPSQPVTRQGSATARFGKNHATTPPTSGSANVSTPRMRWSLNRNSAPRQAPGPFRLFAEKSWFQSKVHFWHAINMLEGVLDRLATIGSRTAMLSTMVIPPQIIPNSVYDFIERLSFFSPHKSCPVERLNDEGLRNMLFEESITMADEKGKNQTLRAWHFNPAKIKDLSPSEKAKPTILLSHGRNSNISHLEHFIKAFTDKNYKVLAYDYAGFGDSTGRASLENCYQSGIQASKYLRDRLHVPTQDQIVVGYSLGTNVSANIVKAMDQKDFLTSYDKEPALGNALPKPKALVMINGFSSLPESFDFQKEKAAAKIPLLKHETKMKLLDRLLPSQKIRNPLRTDETLTELFRQHEKSQNIPTLFFNGGADREVPRAKTEAMAQQLKTWNSHIHIPAQTAYQDLPHSPKAEHMAAIVSDMENFLKGRPIVNTLTGQPLQSSRLKWVLSWFPGVMRHAG